MDVTEILTFAIRSAIGPLAATYALATIGLNIHFGYTGLLNIGQVGFVMVGAYGVAITGGVLGGSLWLGVLVALVLSVVLAALLAVPTLRLRADYLAITTIAVGEVLRLGARSSHLGPLTGGPDGIAGFAGAFYALNPIPDGDYGFWVVQLGNERRVWLLVVGWLLVALCCLVVWGLAHSPWGRVLRAIRSDEEAVRSVGKNVFGYKTQSLMVGGAIGAVGGMYFALSSASVSPDTFDPRITFYAYVILLLGGAGTVLGPVLGSVLFYALFQAADIFLRQGQAAGWLPLVDWFGSQAIGAVRLALVGLGLMLLMIYRPQGILGDRRDVALGV
jgi:branched-chain amino acid transport system permease protein